MKSALLLFAATLFFALSATAFAQVSASAAADRYLAIKTEMGRFSGAVLIVKDEQVILRKGYGFADVAKRVPYTPETQHEVASLSKMFTAMAALRLRRQGKLRLEDSICGYVDDCPAAWKPITVQHLMRHTSGIPDYEAKLELGSDKYLAFMAQSNASAKILEEAKQQPLEFKPGEKFAYSNTGYVVLSYVIQKAAGVPFAEFVRQAILQPAGMKHSGFFGPRRAPRQLARGYTHGDLGWEKMLGGAALTAGHLQPVPQLPLAPPAGDAGLFSTVDDLYRWSRIMDGGGFVMAEEIAEVFTPGLGNYGYGWFVDRGFNRGRLQHNGMLPGYLSEFIKYPDDKLTIILFSNLDTARMRSIVRDLTAIALGAPFDPPVRGKVVKLSAEQLAKLEGEYKMANGAVLTIRNEPDFLKATIKNQFNAGLIPLSATEFYFPLADGKAIFTLDEHGQAVRVNLRYNGEDHPAQRVIKQ